MQNFLSRREMLLRCTATGALRVAAGLSLVSAVDAMHAQEQAALKKVTPWGEMGPFYKRDAPHEAHMRHSGDPGLPMAVSGLVYNTRGDALRDARIEIWHADHHGLYDLDGYRFRSTLNTAANGAYTFDSVMPGHYPQRVCQHVHYVVSAPGHKPLVTQLYFATDPVFKGDPDHNFEVDPLITSREVVRPVMLTADANAVEASVNFDLVLERL